MMALLNTSCLKSGLDDLETYSENNISNVRFEYRWWDGSAEQMRVMEMWVDKNIDKDNHVVECEIYVPDATSKFTETIRSQVSLSTLAINADVSTGASVKPVNDAPKMGVFPSDFSKKEFVYTVTAADGGTANWTIRIKDFQK